MENACKEICFSLALSIPTNVMKRKRRVIVGVSATGKNNICCLFDVTYSYSQANPCTNSSTRDGAY